MFVVEINAFYVTARQWQLVKQVSFEHLVYAFFIAVCSFVAFIAGEDVKVNQLLICYVYAELIIW